jgi:hypothetical protein
MTTLVSVVDSTIEWTEVTITNPDTVSAEINLQGRTLCSIRCDADITATAITFQSARTSGGTFVKAYKQDGTDLSVTLNATATGTYSIAPADAVSLGQFIKVVFGTTPASGTQTIYVGSKVI